MADVAVEKKGETGVEKVGSEEVDGKKEIVETRATEEATTTENGGALVSGEKKKVSEEAKENGDSEAAAATSEEKDGSDESLTPAAIEAAVEESTPANTEENGVEETVTEANGDSTDSAPAEAVKRKVVEGETKTDDANEVTPDKKAKLDDSSKEEVQNGAEASEIAA